MSQFTRKQERSLLPGCRWPITAVGPSKLCRGFNCPTTMSYFNQVAAVDVR